MALVHCYTQSLYLSLTITRPRPREIHRAVAFKIEDNACYSKAREIGRGIQTFEVNLRVWKVLSAMLLAMMVTISDAVETRRGWGSRR